MMAGLNYPFAIKIPGGLPFAALVITILMIGHALAQLTWRLIPDPPVAAELTTPVAVDSPGSFSSSAPRQDLERVAALQLLGRAQVVVENIPSPVVAPETRLNLTLKGILAYRNPEDARALISAGNADEKVYRVGEEISGGAVLHEILIDRVILRRAGRFEALTMPRERMDVVAASSQLSGTGVAQTGAAGGTAQQLRELRDTLIQSPQDAARLIQVQPVMEQGELKGYSLRPGQDRRLFNSVGLSAGDVVTAVNGIPLSDASQLGALFQELSSASTLNISLERRGRSTDLTLNLE